MTLFQPETQVFEAQTQYKQASLAHHGLNVDAEISDETRSLVQPDLLVQCVASPQMRRNKLVCPTKDIRDPE